MAKTRRSERPDPTERVVAAAAEDGPEPGTAGAAAIGARQAVDGSRGRGREPAEDLVVEDEGDDDSGLLGKPGAVELRDGAPGTDLLGGGDAAGTSTSDDPRTDDPGVGGLVGQAGASDGDPLTAFLDAAEAKLGRATGATTPSDQTNASPAHGRPSVAAWGGRPPPDPGPEPAPEVGPETLEQFEAHNGVFIGPQQELSMWGFPMGTPREHEEASGRYALVPDEKPVDSDDEDDDTAPSPPPGSDEVTGEADPPHDPPPEQPAPDPDEVTGEADPPHEPPPAPGPDEEVDPLPADIQEQLDAEVERFRRLRPETGDGTTDPSEIDEEQVGTASPLPTHAELGQELFGQPNLDPQNEGGAPAPNTGADSQGAGVITPGDDQVVTGGAQRDDDPFGEAGEALEPAADTDDGARTSVLLPPDTVDTEVDDRAGLVPDALDLPD